MSKQSRAILEIIRNSDRHMTADEILIECQKREIPISIASIYRNLSGMVQSGEICKLSFLDEPDRYDKCISPHAHLICTRCGQVSDVMIPELMHFLEKQADVTLLSYDLTLKYICSSCKQKGT